MPGLSNRNPVAGYGNIGQVHIRYKPKPPPKRKFGAVFFFFCVSLFLFAYCWTDPWRRYNFALEPLRFATVTYDKIRHSLYEPNPSHFDHFSITLDPFGHPLIEGETVGDVIFGQGYVHAKEHLFQMDYLRHKAYGNLSQYEGDTRLPSDLFVRALNLSGLAENDLLSQSTEELGLLQRYADGVNFYLQENHPLPLEYSVLGVSSVERWHPRHSLCLLRYHAFQLSDSWETELSRKLLAQSLRKDGTAWVGSESDTEPPTASLDQSTSVTTASASWGWVLSGKNTKSGKPLLLTRHSHETSSLSLYVQNTLKSRTEDLHVAGNSIPGTPFVLMGRTKDVAWTVLPSPTGQGSETLGMETLKKEVDCTDECSWLWRLPDGSWSPAEVVTHEIPVRDSKKSTLSMVSLRSIHPQNGAIVLTSDLFSPSVSSLVNGKGPVGSPVAEYLTLQVPSLNPKKRVQLSALVLLNNASNMSQFAEATATGFPFDWQFLFADSSGNIARFVSGSKYAPPPLLNNLLSLLTFLYSPSELVNPPSGQLLSTPELLSDKAIVPSRLLDLSLSTALSVSCLRSPPSYSPRLLSAILKRVASHGLVSLEMSQSEADEVISLLEELQSASTDREIDKFDALELMERIQHSLLEELSPYLRASLLLQGTSISPLRASSSSVQLGVPNFLDELISLTEDSAVDLNASSPPVSLLAPPHMAALLLSLGGRPRFQVRLDTAIARGYREFREHSPLIGSRTWSTRFPHPLQAAEYSGEILSLGPLPVSRDSAHCDLHRWSGYHGSCLSLVSRAVFDLSAPTESFLTTVPSPTDQLSSPFFASTLPLLHQSCQDQSQSRLLWNKPQEGQSLAKRTDSEL